MSDEFELDIDDEPPGADLDDEEFELDIEDADGGEEEGDGDDG